MSSVSVRGDMGNDRDAFVERMSQMAAYDLNFTLAACCSDESEGWLFLEIRIRQTKAHDWDVRNYEARWVREGDEWFLESLVDVASFNWALSFCDRIPASPN